MNIITIVTDHAHAREGVHLEKMTLIMAQHCISRDPFFESFQLSESEPGKVYSIWIQMPGDKPTDYICTCRGFEFRGYCKHQQRVRICGWHELIGPESQTDEQRSDGICPRCGNHTSKELDDDGS